LCRISSCADADLQKVAYPEVRVVLEDSYKPDAAFEKMRAAFADALESKASPH
jgi:hypothetical protein